MWAYQTLLLNAPHVLGELTKLYYLMLPMYKVSLPNFTT